jgi:hypothetical protein
MIKVGTVGESWEKQLLTNLRDSYRNRKDSVITNFLRRKTTKDPHWIEHLHIADEPLQPFKPYQGLEK